MIKIIILSFIACSISCGTSTTTAEKVSSLSASSPENVTRADAEAPGKVVEEFMALVATDKVDEAKAFLHVDRPKPQGSMNPDDTAKSGVDSGPLRLDWIGYFRERNFRLGKVIAEQVDGDRAKIKAELRVKESQTFTQAAEFHLIQDNGRWLISDIEFVFDKPSDIRLSSNVAGA